MGRGESKERFFLQLRLVRIIDRTNLKLKSVPFSDARSEMHADCAES